MLIKFNKLLVLILVACFAMVSCGESVETDCDEEGACETENEGGANPVITAVVVGAVIVAGAIKKAVDDSQPEEKSDASTPSNTYKINLTVSGLLGRRVDLRDNNRALSKFIEKDGKSTFGAPLSIKDPFELEVIAEPPVTVCLFQNGHKCFRGNAQQNNPELKCSKLDDVPPSAGLKRCLEL
ncbi:hypothetical protein WDW89_03665 [Deltaproteobacteria bacterium TL4]